MSLYQMQAELKKPEKCYFFFTGLKTRSVMQVKATKLSKESPTTVHLKYHLTYVSKAAGGGKKKETKSSRATLSFAFLLTWENPISKLKIPISFCNCLHTEAVLSAKTSLKKKNWRREREREAVCRNGKETEKMFDEFGSGPAVSLEQHKTQKQPP